MKAIKISMAIGCAVVIWVLLARVEPGRADIAPPYQPPGANLEPGSEGTQVRMLAETVTIDVQPGSGDSLGKAQVTADFTMRNLGSEAESMAVRFPIGANDGRSNTPELKNLQARVDGVIVRGQRIQGEDPYFGGGSVPWAEFNVTFPTDRDVQVRVSYTLEGTGYAPYVSFYYILSTGAGWKDSIGSADLIVRLPYEANPLNVVLDQQIGWSMTTPGGVMEGNTIRWHYDDLEPTYEDNLDVALVMPAKWQKILSERANVEKDPNDGEAWGRLGKLYKEIAFLSRETRADPAGSELYRLSIDAYEHCLELKPNDADWHAGYAELYYMHYNVTNWENPDDYSDLTRSLELLKRGIEINPRSPKTLELLQEFEWYAYAVRQEDGTYDYPLLTATPTARFTATSPAVNTPTDSPQATVTPPAIQLVETPIALGEEQVATSTSPPASPSTAPPSRITVTSSIDVQAEASAAPDSEAEQGGGLSICGMQMAMLPLGLALVLHSRRSRNRSAA